MSSAATPTIGTHPPYQQQQPLGSKTLTMMSPSYGQFLFLSLAILCSISRSHVAVQSCSRIEYASGAHALPINFTHHEGFEAIRRSIASLHYTMEHGHCRGPNSALLCSSLHIYAAMLNGSTQPQLHGENPVVGALPQRRNQNNNFRVKVTPWLTVKGMTQFYGNDYLDYVIFDTFFRRGCTVLSGSNATYLETGGSNGVHASNTLFFDSFLEWRGINIEPTICATCQLPFNRPHSTNYHGAVCAAESTFNTTGMDGFCPRAQAQCEGERTRYGQMVRCSPISRYIEDSNMTTIDFMSIDVEEFYMTALSSIDFLKHPPRVILVECTKSDCVEYLRERGYHVVPVESVTQTKSADYIAWRNNQQPLAAV